MMKNIYIRFGSALFSLFALCLFSSCGDDKMEGQAPTVTYPADVLYVDLNTVQPPIVCVVNSEVGLRSVDMYIVSKGDSGEEMEEKIGQTITEFYSVNLCSVREAPLFNANMLYFKLIATDLNGQQTVSVLPFEIVARAGLPVMEFTYDEAGENEIDPPFQYAEGSDIADIYLQLSCDDDLKSVIITEVTGAGQKVLKSISFEAGVRQQTINLSTLSGSRYVVPKDILSLNVKATAGALNKERESVLRIDFNPLLEFIINEPEEQFNGIEVGKQVTASGTIASVNAIQNVYYTLLDRSGSPIQSNVPVSHADGSFNLSFAAMSNLGTLVVGVKDVNGNEESRNIDVHVGYKYYRYLVGPVGGGTGDSYGLFLSSQSNEKILSYCDAKENSSKVDAGFLFSATDYNGSIKLVTLDKAIEEFNPSFTDCPISSWSSCPSIPVGESSIAFRNFDKAGIDDFKSVPIVAKEGGVALFRNLNSSSVSGYKVAVYEGVGGKRVLLVVEKMERHDNSSPAEALFYVKMKVQL